MRYRHGYVGAVGRSFWQQVLSITQPQGGKDKIHLSIAIDASQIWYCLEKIHTWSADNRAHPQGRLQLGSTPVYSVMPQQ